MKKTDVAMIILIAMVSVTASYFVAKTVLGDVQNQSVKVKTTTAISKNVDKVDPEIFNDKAINPTVKVIIGDQAAGSSTVDNAQ